MANRWSKIARRIRVPMGFLFAAFFLWRAHPTPGSLILSLALVIPGILLRAYASGCVRKNDALAVTGPYARTRNPLYLGSMLAAFGFAAASRSFWIGFLLAALFALIYAPTILAEEEFLRSAFPEYAAYARSVPRLFPRLRRAPGRGANAFSTALYLKHREYNALIGASAVYAFLLMRLQLRF